MSAPTLTRTRRAELEPEPVVEAEPTAMPRRKPRRRNALLDRWGYYEPRRDGAMTTTRQAEALSLATSRRPRRQEGLISGLNRRGRSVVIADAFERYGDDLENINEVRIGDIGLGKSSGIKCSCVLRPVSINRQVVVADKKPKNGRGEYAPIADYLGCKSVVFKAGGGGARISLLDPMITSVSDLGEDETRHEGQALPASQQALVAAVVEDGLGRSLTPAEVAALERGLTVVTERAKKEKRHPQLTELAEWLLNPPAEDCQTWGELWAEDSRRWGRDVGLMLNRLIHGDLRGLVDGETTDDVRAALDEPFVHFDISGIPASGAAIRVIMTVINTYVSNLAARRVREGRQTIMIFEEGWFLTEGSTGTVARQNMKLSRALAMQTVSAFHHISDMPADSPAIALMKEAGVVYLYGQRRYEDALMAERMYHLPPGTAAILMALPRGYCLVKVGSKDPILMEAVRSPQEVILTDTDDAIKGRPAA